MNLVLPDGAPLPLPYRWILACGLRKLTPWHFIDDQARALALRDEFLLEVEAPSPSSVRDWFPFAYDQTQDDFAGFWSLGAKVGQGRARRNAGEAADDVGVGVGSHEIPFVLVGLQAVWATVRGRQPSAGATSLAIRSSAVTNWSGVG